MFNIIPFKRDHVLPLFEQKINLSSKDSFLSCNVDQLENLNCYTMCWNEEVLACYGAIKIWDRRAALWTVFNEKSKFHFVPIIRAAKRLFIESPFDRIEMAVPISFEIGHRRARLLGCTVETERAKKYFPNGEDCTLYAWIRG